MKKKIKIFILVIALLLLVTWLTLLILNPEPHFRITKDGTVVNRLLYSKIIDQNLSKEWLETNCEIQNQNKILYKCDEYFVETWNQIK